jgi:hypothetical protein
MAAFCACCGAEITRRNEACPVCGTPRHGMVADIQGPLGAGKEISSEKAKDATKQRDSSFRER